MMWDQQCLVIVMTTKTMERGRVKCHQYWEPEVGEAVYGAFSVKTTTLDSNEDYTVASLEIKNLKVRKCAVTDLLDSNLSLNFYSQTDETRNVSHWQVITLFRDR